MSIEKGNYGLRVKFTTNVQPMFFGPCNPISLFLSPTLSVSLSLSHSLSCISLFISFDCTIGPEMMIERERESQRESVSERKEKTSSPIHSAWGMIRRATGDIGGRTGTLLKGWVLEYCMPGIRSTL